jgi:hypothetical protein
MGADNNTETTELIMNRLLTISIAAAIVAVPALTGTAAFAHGVPAQVAKTQHVDDKGGLSRHAEPGDDKGGRARHAEPGDDKGGRARHAEPGDDKGGRAGGGSRHGHGTDDGAGHL